VFAKLKWVSTQKTLTKVIEYPHRFSLYASFFKKPKLWVWAKSGLNPKNPKNPNPALPTLKITLTLDLIYSI
jgi:hypothetical protein